ncbi:CDP-glycerol glycerophosphotransferase family protein [Virgibacillus oceani]|uniref:TarS C-terminal domain-containing protein n=1 Tax=Virgibacillus oceani TaxID=1479511 RepID=A0A917HB10_9BACI|nr:CDP-glycerol glycerophosphotransferase family protein [Virgibacillus oceani]GGG73435.1 hypothetical protein GCM10011398_17370 [Virgibacillus oceani]
MKLLSLLKKRFKKSNEKLKYKLSIVQTQKTLNITGMFYKENYLGKELWLFERNNGDESFKLDEINPSESFSFSVSLKDLINRVKLEDGTTYDWHVKIRRPYAELSEAKKESKQIMLVEENDVRYAEYFIRLGRFQYTNIDNLNFYYEQENHLINYLTEKGNLSLIVNGEPDAPTRLQIDKVKAGNGKYAIQGKMFTRNSLIKHAEIVLMGRDSSKELVTENLKLDYQEQDVKKKYGLNRYTYRMYIDFNQWGDMLEEEVYDLSFRLTLHDKHEPKYVRIGRPTFRTKLFIKDVNIRYNQDTAVINPYFTFKKSYLSFEVYKFPIDTFNYMKKLMRWAWLIRLVNRNKDVWLVGERVYKAQDTGYAFFKYMRNTYPDKFVYYVVDKQSPESKNVKKYGNVLDFKSKEHIFNTIIAKKVISSHHPDYLYPLRTNKFKNKVKAGKVFLQHGVMGTKNMIANYGKNAPSGFDTDIFMVSSEFEKDMIVNDFGYEPNEVFVTGLSRFDTLFKDDVNIKRQLLIIPTWRDWVSSEDAFFESEYFQRYQNLINSTKLHELAEKYNFQILFCLHPNMQKYSKYFKNPFVRVISQGEVNVQDLIKESMIMITDYSSVGFDFSFLHKPVLYYQFDRGLFIGKHPSHLNLDKDLPGDITASYDQLMDLLEQYADNEFKMKPVMKKRADKFITFRDRRSSERIFQVTDKTSIKRDRFLLDHPKIVLVTNGVLRRFRKSSYYFPMMKLFYKIGSKFIRVDNRMILFESGVGKQFGDSPKNIYDELVKQGLQYQKIWVYNKRYNFTDPNTKRIKRLSPQYYYYLLKSGYWVNNQNFPTYIKKRSETTYLQTWHGTPLKKMLYDIDEVQGRSSDYVERVGEAVKNWDYLISPSEYASKAFRSAFRYDGKILETGYPRNDIFYKNNKHEIKEKINHNFNLFEGKKIILYAPTFRDNQTTNKNKFSFDINMDLHKMKQILGSDHVILLRLHVVVSNKINLDEELEGFVYDASKYPDIQELLVATDILITDYSSVMFDYANTGKPMLFYTYDLEEYRDNIRGFYMDFEKEAPGPLLFNTDEIIDSVENIEKIICNFQDSYKVFQQNYCSLEDGYASSRIVDTLFSKD